MGWRGTAEEGAVGLLHFPIRAEPGEHCVVVQSPPIPIATASPHDGLCQRAGWVCWGDPTHTGIDMPGVGIPDSLCGLRLGGSPVRWVKAGEGVPLNPNARLGELHESCSYIQYAGASASRTTRPQVV